VPWNGDGDKQKPAEPNVTFTSIERSNKW
jgi:hypothetical protein